MQNKKIFSLLLKSEPNQLWFVAESKNGQLERKMSHLACFAPGMFALESFVESDPERKAKALKMAEELGHTCHESYRKSTTGLGPEMFYFNENQEAITGINEAGYVLRPEAIESWFYLWRITGDAVKKLFCIDEKC